MRAAVQAAKAGKKVAIVDQTPPGGGCTFFGTVPSKSLREAALAEKHDWTKAFARMRSIVRAESRVVSEQLKRNGITFYRGTARFLSTSEVHVSGTGAIGAASFVVATGASPFDRAEYMLKGAPVYNSDTILSLKRQPRRLLVIGAGVIGCEYASLFSRLGCDVTLTDRRDELLRAVDEEAVEALAVSFRKSGIKILLGSAIGSPVKTKRGLTVKLGRRAWKGEAVLVCLGRKPNTAGLGLAEIGVALDERGQVAVDPTTYATNVPGIFAVGDVIGPPGLAAASAEQGRIAASRLLRLPTEPFPAAFPSGIYTIPEISSFGALEGQLREQKIPYVAGHAYFRELARGLITGEKEGFIKILVHRETRQILGVHAFGAGASELIHIGQVTHALKAPVEFLVQNVFNYPTFAEAYKVAALSALNLIRNHSSNASPKNRAAALVNP
jgi:NAD(P) transhydrogenase